MMKRILKISKNCSAFDEAEMPTDVKTAAFFDGARLPFGSFIFLKNWQAVISDVFDPTPTIHITVTPSQKRRSTFATSIITCVYKTKISLRARFPKTATFERFGGCWVSILERSPHCESCTAGSGKRSLEGLSAGRPQSSGKSPAFTNCESCGKIYNRIFLNAHKVVCYFFN